MRPNPELERRRQRAVPVAAVGAAALVAAVIIVAIAGTSTGTVIVGGVLGVTGIACLVAVLAVRRRRLPPIRKFDGDVPDVVIPNLHAGGVDGRGSQTWQESKIRRWVDVPRDEVAGSRFHPKDVRVRPDAANPSDRS